jgi:ribokinase
MTDPVRTITVVGSVNVDLVVTAKALPREGETVLGDSFQILPGGKGANQAVAAARLGGRVVFVGCVGDDDHGRMARRNLEKHGIDTAGLKTVARHTGVALITIDSKGRNQISVAPGANADVREEGRHDIVLIQLETPYHPPEARLLIVNPAPARKIPLEGVDIIVPNGIEAEQLTGHTDPARAAEALEKMGAGRAIITLGEKGVFDGGLCPAFPVEASDTVGAGDTFLGAFAAALARSDPDAVRSHDPDPVRFAQAAAALKCTRPGAQNAPSLVEVQRFLALS